MSSHTWNDWRQRAGVFERAGRLEAMEELTPVDDNYTRREREVAEVYAARVRRLCAEGRRAEARQAFERGMQFVQAYVRQSGEPDRAAVWAAGIESAMRQAIASAPATDPAAAPPAAGASLPVAATVEAPAGRDEPEWWVRARALSDGGRDDEAEQLILKSVNHIGAASQVAYLYELRFERCLAANDRAGAVEAMGRADHWLATGASWATSGGEGTALNRERFDRWQAMVTRLGFDPRA